MIIYDLRNWILIVSLVLPELCKQKYIFLMVITELYFLGIKRFKMTLVWSKGTNVTFSIVWAHVDKIVWTPEWILLSHIHLKLFHNERRINDPLYFNAVEAMVLVASFPPDDSEGYATAFVELYHKFEFKPLISYFLDYRVRNFSNPVVSFRPRHLYPTLAFLLIWVPLP